ncbi:MAG: SNF2-related protein, partial [Chloroflexota bacterium]
MPNIYDNIEPDQKLLPALQGFIKEAYRADFSVGYFNLRGWGQLDSFIEPWLGGEGACCRLMIGMQSLPKEELRLERSLTKEGQTVIDQKRALRLKRQMAEEFRSQLTFGAPNNADEDCLRRLSSQLKAKKLVVKLFLRNRLHAKLYMLYRKDIATPKIGYLGSSNLTMAGLAAQGELNIDVLDQDACKKLEKWFNDRWEDRWCLDISEDLAEIIDTSWAREEMIRPYHIYLKMAYHLSQEARAGLAEYSIPREFRNKLFDFQVAAVKIAAHHLNKRGGVLVGDVVGLGKTMMASALARIFQEDQQMKVLIICPKNLVKMWEDYMFRYSIQAKVMSIGMARSEDLSKLPRYKLVILDESHNLRNREGKRFRAIQEYIETNDSKCILLTATPYNKTFLDLSSQLRLFVSGEQDLGIRPEKFLSQLSEAELNALQVQPRTLAAFEKSEHIDDWRDLMRLYMVRRTRSFIQENYAQLDKTNGRKYLTFEDGSRSYFPDRVPRTIKFAIDEKKASNQYALLYSEGVVEAVNGLKLPRYGLGNYILTKPKQKPDAAEKKQLDNLSRAGKRLMGFCRTNLFKRLESGGPAFIQSIERHILRNYVFIYALEHGLDLPLGSQDAGLLDTNTYDGDAEAALPGGVEAIDDDASPESDTEEINVSTLPNVNTQPLRTREEYLARAEAIYNEYAAGKLKKRFKWLRPTLLNTDLK